MTRDESYRQAENEIEDALRSNAIELDLSAPFWEDPKPPQLTEIPESLSKLKQLQNLNLTGNKLITIPEWLGQLKELGIVKE